MMNREQMIRNLYDPVVFISLENWGEEDAPNYISYMPLVPLTSPEYEKEFEKLWNQSTLPQGYAKEVTFVKKPEGDSVILEIKLPSFDDSGKSLWERMNSFGEQELELIKYGY